MRPRCKCHGAIMHKAGVRLSGSQRWKCATRNLAYVDLYQRANPAWAAAKAALWRVRHPEDYRRSQALYAAKRLRLKAERNA